MIILKSAEVLWMVRRSLACPHTVASIILIKVIRFLGLSPNCGRVLEDSVSTAIETATISSDKKSLRDMENPLSNARKSVVRIGAITGLDVIKLGLYQLCFLAMILLVGISTFSKSPLIGGETCVQIPFGIGFFSNGLVSTPKISTSAVPLSLLAVYSRVKSGNGRSPYIADEL